MKEEENIKISSSVEFHSTEDENQVIVDSPNIAYSLPMGISKNVDYKFYKRFIQNVERQVRGNTDYKAYLENLRDMDFFRQDVFMNNLNSDLVEIQLHHFPFTLYNISDYVCQKFFEDNEYVSTFMVSNEVIKLHLNDLVGLVPLSTTMHEIEHLQNLPIMERQIFGNWKYIEENYNISDYDKEKIKRLRERRSLNLLQNEGMKYLMGYSECTVDGQDQGTH